MQGFSRIYKREQATPCGKEERHTSKNEKNRHTALNTKELR
jgi:hypothetical protein